MEWKIELLEERGMKKMPHKGKKRKRKRKRKKKKEKKNT